MEQGAGQYHQLGEKLIKFGNLYAQMHNKPRYYGSPVCFSPAERQVLEYIIANGAANVRMSALAQRLGMSSGTFSRNVRRLIDKGFLEKQFLEGDKGKGLILVTDHGREVYAAYQRFVEQKGLDHIFSELLSDVPEEYISLLARWLDAAATLGVQRRVLELGDKY